MWARSQLGQCLAWLRNSVTLAYALRGSPLRLQSDRLQRSPPKERSPRYGSLAHAGSDGSAHPMRRIELRATRAPRGGLADLLNEVLDGRWARGRQSKTPAKICL